jgi:general secretion pathway protein G
MYDTYMKQKGFSLIELLVAIAIIAVLMALAVPNYLGARERARDSKKKSELSQLKTALRLYYNDYQRYPAAVKPADLQGRGTIGGCKVGGTSACPCKVDSFDFATSSDAGCDSVLTIYMKRFPANMTFGNNVDHYGVSGTGEDFCIVTPLENISDADIATSQKNCTSVCGLTRDAIDQTPNIVSNSYVVCSN